MVKGLLFDGKPIILPNDLEEQTPRSSYKVDKKLHELERDVVKRWRKHNICIACIGFENQTSSDPNMSLRVFEYDAIEYQAQRLKVSKNIYPVITLVLYFGYDKPWSDPLSIKERLHIQKELEPYVTDCKINLFQIAYLTREQVKLLKSDFRAVADFFVQMRETGTYNGSTQELQHFRETLQLIGVITHDRHLQAQAEIIKNNPKGGPHTMKGFFDKMAERFLEKGKAEGLAKGIAKGLTEGETKGENKLALLMNKLFSQNRVDDAKRASTDLAFRAKLMKEFAIN